MSRDSLKKGGHRLAGNVFDNAPKLWRGRHVKSCECVDCLKRKLRSYERRIKEMGDPRPPADEDATIPVRAHFRRSRRFLAGQKLLRELVIHIVRGLVREARRR